MNAKRCCVYIWFSFINLRHSGEGHMWMSFPLPLLSIDGCRNTLKHSTLIRPRNRPRAENKKDNAIYLMLLLLLLVLLWALYQRHQNTRRGKIFHKNVSECGKTGSSPWNPNLTTFSCNVLYNYVTEMSSNWHPWF